MHSHEHLLAVVVGGASVVLLVTTVVARVSFRCYKSNPSKSSVRTGPNLGSLATPMSRTENQNRYVQWLDRT
ncbi:hypothetical protein L208DRAFT_1414268, partial [Tricholoma matsutake]